MIPEEVKREAERIKITKFRGDDFINREKEIKYWKETFFSLPRVIQFMYGPKSCGKTTLLEKIRDDIIADKKESKKIAFFWYDLRGELLANYTDVIDFLFEEEEQKEREVVKGVTVGLKGIFTVRQEIKELMKAKRINPFKVMDRLINSKIEEGRRVVIVLDELQALKDIYINNNRTILKELMNYFVRITKVEHKAVVIGMSSNAFFIEELYNDSTLEKASEFVYLDYLRLPEVYAWLMKYGFRGDEIEYIWEKVGGDNYLLSKIVESKKRGYNWREVIEIAVEQAKGRIIDFLTDIRDKEVWEEVRKILKIMVKSNGRMKLKVSEFNPKLKDAMRLLVDNEVLFFNPLRAELWVQFKSYYDAMKEIFK
jgi:AAA+ ATPase superfamily predicted ATPase